MNKTINIGAIDMGMAQKSQVFLKVSIEGAKSAPRIGKPHDNGTLSITGVVGPLASGDAQGSCGQIDGTIGEAMDRAGEFEPAPGWTRASVRKLLQVWDKWHLNDMRAGCEHQRADEWDKVRIDPKELPDSHANRDSRGIMAMWVTQDEHKDGLLSKPCLVCGYKYGTKWLKEALPDDVVSYLEKLPESTRKPAWV